MPQNETDNTTQPSTEINKDRLAVDPAKEPVKPAPHEDISEIDQQEGAMQNGAAGDAATAPVPNKSA